MSTPRSPAASCAPTPAASQTATSKPSSSCSASPPTSMTPSTEAVKGLRDFGYSWAEIGSRLGITRQAAQQRWGHPLLTAATAALESRTRHGPGTWGDRRRHRDHLLGRLPRLGTPARQLRRLLAPDPAARPHRRHRPGHRRDRPGLRHRQRARGSAARRLRQPPRGGLPGLLGGVQAGRPAARPRGPGRGQGHPRDDHRAPVRVRHPHRAVVRPGPLPADARQDRAALPSPPRRQGPPLPARPGHLLPDPPRRGRSPARPADVRRLLRLHRRRPVQRLGREAVAPVHHLPAPPPGPPPGHHPETAPRPGPRPLRQGGRIPGPRRRPLPRRDPPGRPRR